MINKPQNTDNPLFHLAKYFLAYLSNRWESLFFVVVVTLLYLQVILFASDAQSVSTHGGLLYLFESLMAFVAGRLSSVLVPVIFAPLVYLLACRSTPRSARKFLDGLGIYLVVRMAIQLIGLNILVFDFETSRFLLITQLLFFLPYSLLVWGWIYWRLDTIGRKGQRPLFRFDFEGEMPRPLDYFVASFSSVFSPTINAIKGNSARARMLILGHGLLIYDVMGLTLSRAVALVQSR